MPRVLAACALIFELSNAYPRILALLLCYAVVPVALTEATVRLHVALDDAARLLGPSPNPRFATCRLCMAVVPQRPPQGSSDATEGASAPSSVVTAGGAVPSLAVSGGLW